MTIHKPPTTPGLDLTHEEPENVYTPHMVDIAFEHGHFDVMETTRVLPTSIGADHACGKNKLDVIDRLMIWGIEPTWHGMTLACQNGHIEMLKKLLPLGYRPLNTGVAFAREAGYSNVVSLLKSYDINVTNEIEDDIVLFMPTTGQ